MLDIIKTALRAENRRFFRTVHRKFREDANYSLLNLFRTFCHFGKDNKITVFNNRLVMGFVIPPIPSKPFMTYLNATRNDGGLFTQNALLQKTAPLTFSLGVTSRCGYNYLYCSAKGRQGGEELTTGEWVSVIRTLQDMGTAVLSFTGGEPLLREDLEELIGSVDDRSMCILFTSGQGLTREKASALRRAGLYGVTISLDSCDQSEQNRRRGSDDAYSNAISGVNNALLAGLYTCVSCVVTRDMLNKKVLFRTLAFFERLKAQEVILIPPFNSGRWMGKDDEFYTRGEREAFVRLCRACNRRFKHLKVSSELNNCSTEHFGCAAGVQHSHISPVGELYPCEIAPMSFGSICSGDLKALWGKMRDAVGTPHLRCLADEVFCGMSGESLPLSPERSMDVCASCRPASLPAFYRKLMGG